MLFKNLTLASCLAAVAAAAPAPQLAPGPLPEGAKFGLIAIHSTSPVHNSGLSASQSRIWINHEQNAECDKPSEFATFTIQDGGLYLYAASATPQQLFVDRSGMGQGITGYTTGAQPPPKNGEETGFAVSAEGRLEFDGTDFQACPTGREDGSYALWLAGVSKPAGLEGCIGVALRAIEAKDPISCVYTQ